MKVPRVVVAGTHSGAGKTSVACGLIGALRACGHRVQGFKVGPDFIDPTFHALASGRPGRNLDAFLSGPELVAPLFRHGSSGADIAVIEGVMGMFDGASGRGELASTAHVAKLLQAPVVLVVDAGAMARSAAAIVLGYRTFDPDLQIAGVILNRLGSDGHEQLVRDAIESMGMPVLGAIRRDDRMSAPERHLGLVPAGERNAETKNVLERLTQAIASSVDLDAVVGLARGAPALADPAWAATYESPASGARIAVAKGPAFSFYYEENLELLEAAGAELLDFDPLTDPHLPDGAGALVFAGGFPEVFGPQLASNETLKADVRAFPGPIVAECGGLLYLCKELDGRDMCGVLGARASMTEQLTLGYREAKATTSSNYAESGEAFRGHEFHYSQVVPTQAVTPAWALSARGVVRDEGFVSACIHASFLHVHWAAFPQAALRLARAASAAHVHA